PAVPRSHPRSSSSSRRRVGCSSRSGSGAHRRSPWSSATVQRSVAPPWVRHASFPSWESTASMLESFIQWLLERFRDLGYPGIVVLMAVESSILPLPSELVMPPAGYLVAKGEMDFLLALACGVLGSILGSLANYGLARWLGRA